MAVITIPGMFLTGDHASRPAANAVGSGSIYSCTTHSLLYQSDGSSWSTWATLGETGAAAHIADASDAHDASAISVADSGANFTGTDVEAVLAELQDNIDGVGGGGSANITVYNRNSTSYTTTSTSFTDVDATNLDLAVTVQSANRRVQVSLCGAAALGAAGLIFFDLLVDGTSVSGGEGITYVEPAANQTHNASFTYITAQLSAASHNFKLQWKVSGNTATLFAGDGGASVLQFVARELI